jgi:3-phosphoinositide dependent protein kinase-1
MGSLSTACARYYAAQLVDALDYMHLRGVIHRYAYLAHFFFLPADRLFSDLKPENLLLDDEFRIKVTDFGTGKLIDVPRSFFRTYSIASENPSSLVPAERATKTFVGTAQYVSPELLEANETSKRHAPTCSCACQNC